MQLPEIKRKADSITMLSAFKGLNRNAQIEDAEFSDMKCMSNDSFPVLTNRQRRGIIQQMEKPQGVLGGKYLAYVDNNTLYYNFEPIKELEESDVERQLVMMGAYLVVYPDGVIYNTYTKELDNVRLEFEAEKPKFSLCKLDGTAFNSENTWTGDTEPEDKKLYWIDTSQNTVVIKMWSESYSSWLSVGTTYVKVQAYGIGDAGFKPYDAAYFSGVDEGIPEIYNNYKFNQTNIIFDVYHNESNPMEDYLIIVGFINKVFYNSGNVTIKRGFPMDEKGKEVPLDFITENNNRLWACSSEGHAVYSCKMGDPKNWNCFVGLDSDSYAATVGTQNEFTGIVAYSGYLFFFKEDGFHKLYGSKPSNFEMQWKPCRGVQKGSSKSIAVVSEILFYKAKDAVVLFDGSVNVISSNLGLEPFYDAVGGEYRNKYYLSMRDANYDYKTYVYDITKGTWVIDDELQVNYFAYANDGMYLIDYHNTLMLVNNEKMYQWWFPNQEELGDRFLYPFPEEGYDDPETGEHIEPAYPGQIVEGDLEDIIEWSFTTGDIGMNSPYQKYLKRIIIRLQLDTSAKIRIEAMYDSSDVWEQVYEYYCTNKRSYEVPIQLRRCDHVKLKFSGRGDIKLFSIAKATEEGSSING